MTTPLSVYLKLREHFTQVLLLESSDYSSREDSQSYICCDSISSFVLDRDTLKIDGVPKAFSNITKEVEDYLSKFEGRDKEEEDGVYGYTTFDSVAHFDRLKFPLNQNTTDYPTIRYDFYRYVIKIDHFKSTLTLIEHCPEGEERKISFVKQLLDKKDSQTFSFGLVGEEKANMLPEKFLEMVRQAKEHCQRGDVFQLVLSRRFEQAFQGDDLNVYRALRSINPSPYLFYFDYGSYKIFGSSPEAQLKVKGNKAEIHPIAGTFRRTGDVQKDAALALELAADPKENAEHVMLVDLARNDLSKSCRKVSVVSYKEVQYFSHVIHLTSKVEGEIQDGKSAYHIFGDTFPAGTLSGAPKYKALELINKYEGHQRGFYGGGIGMLSFNGDLNHAIIIRSFLSQNGKLKYQAGAGLVISSDEGKELQEVNNKLAALKKAIQIATTL